jgi:molecular chaperone GrpE
MEENIRPTGQVETNDGEVCKEGLEEGQEIEQVSEDGEAAGEETPREETQEQPSLEQQLEECRKKNEEYYDRLLRLQADFENYKKRIAREKEEIYNYISGEILAQFLGVLDNMERALNTAKADNACTGCDSVQQGIKMVVKQFNDILSKYDVEEIPAEGEKFDPNLHYAVMQVDESGEEEGTIVEVLQKGYRLKSKVLRPSMVKVAK